MSVFRLYQIRPSREQFDRVNELGSWSKAYEEMPIIEASQAVRMGGADAWVSSYDEFYEHVADINTQGVGTVEAALEQCFHVHNNPEGLAEFEAMITRYGSQHSMSVGDILVDCFGGVHMVDSFGFTQILSSEVGTECIAAA